MIDKYYLACTNNDLNSLNLILPLLSPEQKVSNNNEALDRAVRPRNWQIVKRLLEEASIRGNADVNDNEVLATACEAGRDDIVEILLTINSVRANAAVENNYCLQLTLANAIEFPKILNLLSTIPVVNAYLQAGNSSTDHVDSINWSTGRIYDSYFLDLCRDESWDLAIKALIDPSTSRDAAAHDNLALRLACESGCFDMVEALLKIESVRNKVMVCDNQAIKLVQARCRSIPRIVELLKEVPCVQSSLQNKPQF